MDMLRVQEWKWNIPFHVEGYFSQKKKRMRKTKTRNSHWNWKGDSWHHRCGGCDVTKLNLRSSNILIKESVWRLRLKKEFKLKVPPLTTGGVSPTTRQQGFGFCLDKSPDLKDSVFSLSDHSCSSTVWWTEWKHNRRRVCEKHSWPCCQSEQNS